MKTYDAIVLARIRVSNVCNEDDLTGGLTFHQLAKDLIESEGLMSLSDEVEILHVDQREREE